MKRKLTEKSKRSIHEYCNKICMKIKESKEIVKELHEEMAANMKEHVFQLIESGIEQDKAVETTINKQPPPQQMVNELSSLYRTRKFISAFWGYLTIASAVVGILLVSTFYYWNNNLYSEQMDTLAYGLRNIPAEFVNDGINDDVKAWAANIVDKSNNIEAIWLGIRENNGSIQPYDFVYPSSVGLDVSAYPRTDGFFTNSFFSGASIELPNTNVILEADMAQTQMKYNVLLIGLIAIAIYWFSFSLWALKNLAYVTGKHTISAILIIIIFNFIGFLVYNNVIKYKNSI